jgi:hypothetical protein|tara:strand:+ start:2994 stop:3578 length:585 start_codon:yes stop_codon:yes gene_type:complete
LIGVKPVFKDEYNKTSGIIITLKDSDIQKAKDFTNKVIKAKAKERHHKTDSKSVYKRFLTGTLGELALEELLGIKVVNWNVGKSTTFKNPDLKHAGFDVGIKTVNYGMFPLVSKNPQSAEIINIKLSDNKICMLGMVTVEDLRVYTDDALLLDKNAKQRKTAFWNLSAAKSFNSVASLRYLHNSDSWSKIIDWD